jgi:flagellar hook protein FlgE
MDVTAAAKAGMASAMHRFQESAQRTANMDAPGARVDLAAEIAAQLAAKAEFRANLMVLRTADEMIGESLDLKV